MNSAIGAHRRCQQDVGFPTISSLSSLTVAVSDDVKHHLAKQYEGLYRRNGDDGALEAGLEHVDHILIKMKTAPATTCCRVNTLRATREEVMKGLDDALLTWRTGRGRRPVADAEDVPEKLKHLTQMKDKHDGGERVDTSMCAYAHGLFDDCVLIGPHTGTSAFPLTSTGPHMSGDENTTQGEVRDREWPVNMSSEKRKVRVDRGWPATHRVVICDRLCGESVLRGSDIFVRGIISADSGVRQGEQVAVYADLGDSAPLSRGLVVESYSGHSIFLGLGKACCSRAEMFNLQEGLGVEMSAGKKVGANLPSIPRSILEGKILLQNLPSVLVGHVLGPLPRETILDMCCAPGGKTSHVASIMGNEGLIVACDRSRKKVVSSQRMFNQMGATCIVPIALDSTKLVASDGTDWISASEVISRSSRSSKDGLPNVKSFYPASFDRIVLDPPCSALGLRPKLRVDGSPETLNRHAHYQKKFIRAAVSLLKPGGIMTYSTCTINATENEVMVRHILDEYPELELVPIELDIGLPGLPALGLNKRERYFVRRFDPSDDLDTMGFFVAKFMKCDKDN